MKFFIDTAEVDQIKALIPSGMVDGVTTNPSLIAKSGRDILEVIKEICSITNGSVSAEVTAMDSKGMITEGEFLYGLADNICVKVPLTWEGIEATHALSSKGIPVNVTLCFSANQALMAAKAGAAFISPFIGRLDDIGQNGCDLIKEIRVIYDNYSFETEILAASIRNLDHMRECALIGADVATAPPNVIRDMVKHSLTDKGLAAFMNDWKKTGQSIL
ncbi:MAG: fructose-6-phosphate aldolase [Robiginitomaculum sp.]